MLRKWVQRGLLVLTTALVGSSVGSGCSDPESMLFIRQVVLRKAPDCAAQAEPDGLTVLSGVLDVSFGLTEYQGTLLVGNQILSRGSGDLVRTETSRVGLTRAEVTTEDASGNQFSTYSVPITGFVDQGTGQEPGFGLATLPLADSATINAVKGSLTTRAAQRRVVSKIKIFGNTLGGSEVYSGEFQFIIQVCNGCLVSFPADADDAASAGVDCNASSTTSTTGETPCTPGQDTFVDCRLCRGSNPACQAPGP